MLKYSLFSSEAVLHLSATEFASIGLAVKEVREIGRGDSADKTTKSSIARSSSSALRSNSIVTVNDNPVPDISAVKVWNEFQSMITVLKTIKKQYRFKLITLVGMKKDISLRKLLKIRTKSWSIKLNYSNIENIFLKTPWEICQLSVIFRHEIHIAVQMCWQKWEILTDCSCLAWSNFFYRQIKNP